MSTESRCYLAVDDSDCHCYRLSWYFPDEGEFGGSLGDGPSDSKLGDPEVLAAEAAILAMPHERDSTGFRWESAAAARRALAVAKAAIKAAKLNRVIPEWEKTAIANGWKAPRGWGQ